MMGYRNYESAEDMLQKAWDAADGEITFDAILKVILDYHGQFDEEIDDIIGEVEDPFYDIDIA
jgi:hypothetical protein